MNICLENWANIFTIVLGVAAIVAGFLAWRNIIILKEQRRIDTFLSLIDQMANQRERDNRAETYGLWQYKDEPFSGLYSEENIGQRIANFIDHTREIDKRGGAENKLERRLIRQRDAIEQTISCLDKVGFFLLGSPPKLKVDHKLKDEAPTWIWSIASDMWSKLGEYVLGVQKGVLHRKISEEGQPDPHYGRYFTALVEEATKQFRG